MKIDPAAMVQVKDDDGINQTGGGAWEKSPQVLRLLHFGLEQLDKSWCHLLGKKRVEGNGDTQELKVSYVSCCVLDTS